MADNLIKPEVATPRGIPPKYLLISLVVLLTVVAMGFSLMNTWSREDEPITGDGVARKNASRLSAPEKSELGLATATVKEVADANGLPADFRRDGASGPLPPASAPRMLATAMPASIGPNPVANHGQGTGVGGPGGGRDAGEAAREVEAINSKIVVADFGDSPSRPVTSAVASDGPLSDVERLMQVARADAERAKDGVTSGNPTAQLAAMAMAATRGAPSGRALDNQFLQEFENKSPKNGIRATAPEGQYMVMEGTVMPAVTQRDLVSDLPGVVTAMVNQDVYDSLTSNQLLVCKGAKLIGRYSNGVRNGQSRLLFAFTRLILRDGQSFNLAGFDGSDLAGGAGATGDVDTHFWRTFGSSLAIGFLADQVVRPAAVPSGLNGGTSATGQVLIETAKEQLSRGRDISSTITVPKGSRINVEVRRDMLFSAQANCKS